jgi:formylglycine-generating enzyme required for sulfatase activity
MHRPCAAMVLITALRARWNGLTALTLAGAISTCWATSAFAQPPTLELVLKRTAQYVEQFVDQFSNVVAEERYVQDTLGNLPMITAGRGALTPVRPASRHRELKSDFLLVKVGPLEWLPFRDVYEVDGTPIRDREGRLAKLFLRPTATSLEQASQIAAESARYNLGAVQRTINTPILPLIFLYADVQPRFRFSLGKREPSVGSNIWIVEYKEETKPTLVRGVRDSNLPASGRYWIDAETGRVAKAQIDLETAGIRARLTISFRRDEKFDIDVPFEMQELYSHDRGTVSGTATYGHFRRFDVNSDESFHNPTTVTIADRRTGMTLVEIPSGRFTMGSSQSEAGRNGDEGQHDVTINRPFFLGQHEVTQQEWQTVMNTNPSTFKTCGPRCPVENVSLSEIKAFLAALNAQAGNEVVYRLPTEAEWEYACRAGTATAFSTGENITTVQANFNGKLPNAGTGSGMFREHTTRSGGFPPNAWGLVDMHGNVSEWTADWYGEYPAEDVNDPSGAASGTTQVVRGGNWQAGASAARCASRSAEDPSTHNGSIGFRIAADRAAK